MVDETEFRATFDDLNALPCPFKKAIFSTVCGCEKSERIYIGDREAMVCSDALAQRGCAELIERLRAAARFALQVSPMGGLPHAKAIKVETGGLLGLQAALDPQAGESGRVENVYALLNAATARFGSLSALPYGDIIREVARYTPKVRRRGRRRPS
jgi:hypothetical protein